MRKPTLDQATSYFEYPVAQGIRTCMKADEVLEDMFASGDISSVEKPRIVAYYAGMKRRYAIAAIDTTIQW